VVRRTSNLTIPGRLLHTAGGDGSSGMAKAGSGGRGREWRRWDELYEKGISLVSSSTRLLTSMG